MVYDEVVFISSIPKREQDKDTEFYRPFSHCGCNKMKLQEIPGEVLPHDLPHVGFTLCNFRGGNEHSINANTGVTSLKTGVDISPEVCWGELFKCEQVNKKSHGK